MSKLKDDSGRKSIDDPGLLHHPQYVIRLFVSGFMQNSVVAIKNLTRICESHLKGNFQLEIIDIYQRPDLAISEQIIVIPVTIIKKPLPERRIIGDLSDIERVLEIMNS